MNLKEIQLSCKNLSFSYGKGQEPVFSGLSLTVGKGEAVLLMGPSGCGKSTLAYCLAGLYPEYAGELEGEIFLEGEALSSYGPARRAKTVSILFQNPDNQFCMERVEHEVLFALENINYQGDMRARTEKLLEQVGLAAWASYPIRTLSGGMKQKLALATALATGARLLILDEPTAGLDPKERVRFRNLISSFSKDKIVLLSTHIVSDVEYIADEILVMKEGRLIHRGAPEVVTREAKGLVWECKVDSRYADRYVEQYNVGNLKNAGDEDHPADYLRYETL